MNKPQGICQLAGCNKQVHQGFNYCSKAHGKQAQQNNANGGLRILPPGLLPSMPPSMTLPPQQYTHSPFIQPPQQHSQPPQYLPSQQQVPVNNNSDTLQQFMIVLKEVINSQKEVINSQNNMMSALEKINTKLDNLYQAFPRQFPPQPPQSGNNTSTNGGHWWDS